MVTSLTTEISLWTCVSATSTVINLGCAASHGFHHAILCTDATFHTLDSHVIFCKLYKLWTLLCVLYEIQIKFLTPKKITCNKLHSHINNLGGMFKSSEIKVHYPCVYWHLKLSSLLPSTTHEVLKYINCVWHTSCSSHFSESWVSLPSGWLRAQSNVLSQRLTPASRAWRLPSWSSEGSGSNWKYHRK
jgi:hypothetical protein